jgi:protein-S-isoprenylcysteine O-methyltransferase Ste14
MTESTMPNPTLNRYGYNSIARHLFTAVIVSVILFLGAGTTDWTWGWIFSVVHFLCWLGLSLVLARWNPELLNQRGKRTESLKGTKPWDWVLLGIYTAVVIVQPLVAGLDYRYNWSTAVPTIIYIIGYILLVLSFAVLAWAMAANRFFETTVRIQEERGQQVETSGPYQVVRHPGYAGVILSFIGLPLALGSRVALIPGVIGIIVFIIRSALEDRTLLAELPGYTDFAQQTRYRLFPGIW